MNNLPINMWFPKIRIGLVRWLVHHIDGDVVPISYLMYQLRKEKQYDFVVWYGFGTDWKGIMAFICSRLFYRRSGDWWKVHSVLVNVKNHKYYHLTDEGAQMGNDVISMPLYPLDYYIVTYPVEVSLVERRHNVAVKWKFKVSWLDAFLWALGLKDDVYLCHHHVNALIDDSK